MDTPDSANQLITGPGDTEKIFQIINPTTLPFLTHIFEVFQRKILEHLKPDLLLQNA
jgi:hypothetical protein